ncbi:MAG: PLP-dependent transferase [Deltaproteobacteria bacterium]|nr:PLP-dependent transferase [Deltaproteobacteria bacterium]
MTNPELHLATLAVMAGRPTDSGAPLNAPVVLASNARDVSDYARNEGTDTWRAFEDALGTLEGGRTVAFASGLAAASAIAFTLAAEAIVLPRVSYYGVRQLLRELANRGGARLVEVAIDDSDAVLRALDDTLRATSRVALWIETPTNPTLDEADLPVLCRAAGERGVPVVVDSTFATPLRLRPLEQGASIVLHSATKFIGGHSDLLLGAAVARDPALADALCHARSLQGATPGALEAFLALRGLRTLPLRYEAASRSASLLAARLGVHPWVTSVKCCGPMIAFVVRGGAAAAERVCASTRVIVHATSLGGVESSMERRQKYAGDAHVEPGLVRLSVGVEHAEDLWRDLERALATADGSARA